MKMPMRRCHLHLSFLLQPRKERPTNPHPVSLSLLPPLFLQPANRHLLHLLALPQLHQASPSALLPPPHQTLSDPRLRPLLLNPSPSTSALLLPPALHPNSLLPATGYHLHHRALSLLLQQTDPLRQKRACLLLLLRLPFPSPSQSHPLLLLSPLSPLLRLLNPIRHLPHEIKSLLSLNRVCHYTNSTSLRSSARSQQDQRMSRMRRSGRSRIWSGIWEKENYLVSLSRIGSILTLSFLLNLSIASMLCKVMCRSGCIRHREERKKQGE